MPKTSACCLGTPMRPSTHSPLTRLVECPRHLHCIGHRNTQTRRHPGCRLPFDQGWRPLDGWQKAWPLLLFASLAAIHMSRLHEYQVVGRKLPSTKDVAPRLYRMRIFAPNTIVARSRFWYFLKKLKKVKKAAGEIVGFNEIFEARPEQIKNYGIWIRYDSRSGTHNMYKEYREMSRCEAVAACYLDMAARHRARFRSVQIMRVAELKASEVKRPYIKQLLVPKLAFPLPHRVHRVGEKKHRALFLAKSPSTFN